MILKRATNPQVLPRGCWMPAHQPECPCAQTALTAFSHTWQQVVQASCPFRSNNLTKGVSNDGTRESEKSELLWFHLSEVKHLNQQHFYFPRAWGPTFFFLQSSLWERCSRIFFPRNKLRTTLTLQQNYKHWEHMCIIWLKAQTEKVSLKMPRSYLLVISRLKYHSTLSSRTPPSHQQIRKAPPKCPKHAAS